MQFNSWAFAIFLPIVFGLYWFVVNRNWRLQNALLLVSSYIFYGWWDWRFLSLILFSTVVDYALGIALSRRDIQKHRKFLLIVSLVVNLGLLGFFKYYNFFIDSWIDLLEGFGISANVRTLNIILPVGISFYTFQTLSYTIDIYRKKITPTRDFIAFATFVAFFPQLVAGPIERAANLLPQFFRKREFAFEKGMDGLRQIGWGLLKKIVIADNCAAYVDDAFANFQHYSGSELALGVIYFAFQIYGDFSGYSDIAIGIAKLFGFNLMVNFKTPYFSRNIAEFWRRWHISLSSWFRDYLYIPLGGSRGSLMMTVLNVLIVFGVSGFWHGANWTFVVWGLLNGVYFLPLMLVRVHKRYSGNHDSGLPSLRELISIVLTFGLTCVGWIFFRADTIQHAWLYLKRITSVSLFRYPNEFRGMLPFILIFIIVEWIGKEKEYPLFCSKPSLMNNVGYFIILALLIALFGNFGDREFIYFQF